MRKIVIALSVALFSVSVSLLVLLCSQVSQSRPAVPAVPTVAITQLTDGEATDLRPVWSPDNRWIAFESDREGGTFHIYVMRPDGSGLRAVTSGPADDRRPVWTPDGASVLYDSFDGIQQEIWSIDLTSGNRQQLTHMGGLASFASARSDGKAISFYLYKDGALDLWVANADGTQARPLTQELARAENEQCTFACHQAAWSPDGRHIAFTGGDGRSIWIIGAEGGEAQPVIIDDETNHFPWFLPDGRLGFVTEYTPPRYGAAWTDAYAYNLDTGERSTLVDFMSLQGPVDWSNDGSLVLFHSPRAGRFSTYVVNLNVSGGLAALQGKLAPEQ